MEAKLSNASRKTLFEGRIKIRKEDLRMVDIRGTKGFVLVEFAASSLPKIELEVSDRATDS